jgi:hypothetical protein
LTLEQPASGAGGQNRNYRHSSYRGVAGAAGVYGTSKEGWFDNNQWSGVLPEKYKGIFHVVGVTKLSNELISSIRDGTSNTLMIGEYMTRTTTRRGTFWAYSYGGYVTGSVHPFTACYVPDYDYCTTQVPSNFCKRDFASFHPGGIQWGLCDGSARMISNTVDLNLLVALSTIGFGEPVQLPD